MSYIPNTPFTRFRFEEKKFQKKSTEILFLMVVYCILILLFDGTGKVSASRIRVHDVHTDV